MSKNTKIKETSTAEIAEKASISVKYIALELVMIVNRIGVNHLGYQQFRMRSEIDRIRTRRNPDATLFVFKSYPVLTLQKIGSQI